MTTIIHPAPEKIEKLPKWARDYMDSLLRRNTRLEESLALVGRQHANTDTWLETGIGMAPIPLPRGQHIQFRLPQYGRFGIPLRALGTLEARIARDADEGHARLLLMGLGSHGLTIRPQATNVIEVYL